jgi:hypothetical protein
MSSWPLVLTARSGLVGHAGQRFALAPAGCFKPEMIGNDNPSLAGLTRLFFNRGREDKALEVWD